MTAKVLPMTFHVARGRECAYLVRTVPHQSWSKIIHFVDEESIKRDNLQALILGVNTWWDEEELEWCQREDLCGEYCLLEPMAGHVLEEHSDGSKTMWVEERFVAALIDAPVEGVLDVRNLDRDPIAGEPWR